MVTEKIQEKIKRNQAFISTNEDLSKLGYNKDGKNQVGTIRWRSKEYDKRNREKRVEERREYQEKYYQENGEKKIEYLKKYLKTSKGKIVKSKIDAKSHAKRKRALGFEPLNEWFPESEAHHIDKNTVIYIPKELHRSISHNVFTGKGMEEINKLAFEFLEKGMFETNIPKSIGRPRNLIFWKKEQQKQVA